MFAGPAGGVCEQLPRGGAISPPKRRVCVGRQERRQRTSVVRVGEAAKPTARCSFAKAHSKTCNKSF